MILDRYQVAKTPRMSKRMVALFRDPTTPVEEREANWPCKKGLAGRFYHIMLKDGLQWADKPYEIRRVWLMVDEHGNPSGQGRFGEAQRVGWHKTEVKARKYLDELFTKKLAKLV